LKSNRSRSLKTGPIDRSYSRACVTITSSGVCFVTKQLASTSFRGQVLSTLLVQRWRGSSGNVRLSNLLISSCSFSVRHLFQFRFWPYRRNCHVILRQHATFHQYRIIHGGDITSYQFSRWRPQWRNFTSVSDLVTSLSSEGQCLAAYEISSG